MFRDSTIISVLIAILILFGLIYFFALPKTTDLQPSPLPQSSDIPTPNSQNQASNSAQLQIVDEKIGTGTEAKTDNTVSVNYLGTLANGQKFDSSYDRNQPFEFKIGGGEVIKGWDQGVLGMKVGGKRKLTIPPSLGYGSQANGPIPANSTLIFEIELLDVK